MTIKDRIFLESKVWAAEIKSLDRDYFVNLDRVRTPSILWIGSTDSLINVNELINTDPGELHVYNNIANQVRQDDISMMAMIEDAVVASGVDYIVVCGYSHCTGIRDVLAGVNNRPIVDQWLDGLKGIYAAHQDELDALDMPKRHKKLAELNIEQQIKNLSKLPCIQDAWNRKDFPKLYGWYFDLTSATLKEVVSMEQNHKIEKLASLV